MQLSFEWYVQELAHWPLVRAMVPGLKMRALLAVESLTLLACTAGYYLLDHNGWTLVATSALGLMYFGLNHLLTGRWVRSFLVRQGKVPRGSVSHLDLVEELRVERLVKKAEETGRAVRVVEIEHATTAAQAEIEKLSVVGPPAWLGKVAAWIGPMALSLVVALGDTPREKLLILALSLIPILCVGMAVSLVLPWMSSRRSNMLAYMRVLLKAKRHLDLSSAAHAPLVAGASGGHDVEPPSRKITQLK